MTTAARPTPALMPSRRPAARPDTPTVGAPPRPSARREPWQQAILASSLPANFRFVAVALSTHADGTGHIAQQPRVIGLVHNTGINARQVAVALTALRDRGFLRLSPPDGRYDTADLILTMPRGAAARARRAQTATARSSADA
ncbi:hypothetical protein OG413_15770 [Streptomyces sp. NBC_01433]|uniref:hypothetical protein n=1 Tax=Streptomyces sp. NBC_01433 TaxID=2903864 RepID=UPI00224F2DB2|nr:hypothetical protein [Streptomyces sp. NBC_01433]MCX4676743.1 hypothetical protein [Streptomyces sp. NBC_01433]